MASIEKRGERSYRLVVEVGYTATGKRKKKYKTIKVEDVALLRAPKRLENYLNEELVKFKIEVEAGVYIAPEKMKFEKFIEEWEKNYASDPDNLSPASLHIYKLHIKNHILPAFGHMQLDNIKPIQIVTFLKDLEKPGKRKDNKNDKALSSGTIEYIYRVLKNIFTRAYEWKIIKEHPMEDIKKPKAVYAKPKYYEEEEAQLVIEKLFLEPRHWRLFCLGALIGGFRRGEILALEWDDINFERSTIAINENIPLTRGGKYFIKTPKSKASIAEIKMPKWYMDELQIHHKEWKKEKMQVLDRWQGGDREFVFHAGLGRPFYFTQPSKWFKSFLKKHDLKEITFHQLRHSTATLLLADETPLKAIQKRLRHSKYETTANIYTHVTKKLEDSTTDKFEKFNPKSMRG